MNLDMSDSELVYECMSDGELVYECMNDSENLRMSA